MPPNLWFQRRVYLCGFTAYRKPVDYKFRSNGGRRNQSGLAAQDVSSPSEETEMHIL